MGVANLGAQTKPLSLSVYRPEMIGEAESFGSLQLSI
jgi:hypothetical protein